MRAAVGVVGAATTCSIAGAGFKLRVRDDPNRNLPAIFSIFHHEDHEAFVLFACFVVKNCTPYPFSATGSTEWTIRLRENDDSKEIKAKD